MSARRRPTSTPTCLPRFSAISALPLVSALTYNSTFLFYLSITAPRDWRGLIFSFFYFFFVLTYCLKICNSKQLSRLWCLSWSSIKGKPRAWVSNCAAAIPGVIISHLGFHSILCCLSSRPYLTPTPQLASKVWGDSYAFVRCQEQVKIKINTSTALRARAVRLNTPLRKAKKLFPK